MDETPPPEVVDQARLAFTQAEARKQVDYHLDRALAAAKRLDGDAAVKLRKQIVLAALQATNC